MEGFSDEIRKGYTVSGGEVFLGKPLFEGKCFKELAVEIPLKMLNRHGLITGATGTGKTKTLQVMAEELSEKGVPVLLMDLKGDLSGLSKPLKLTESLKERDERLGDTTKPERFPVTIFSLTGHEGIPLRATVQEFGAPLMSRLLNLNETQTGVMTVLFEFCKDEQMPLLDIRDLKAALNYISSDGMEKVIKKYGNLSSASVGAILRQVLQLESEGASSFFGERSLDIMDLLRFDDKGRGMISLINLKDVQDKPRLFSTLMLFLLVETYSKFGEVGDLEKPKFVLMIDEAHLLFEGTSKALLDKLEGVVRLIRSKGVGIYLSTQSPTDVPKAILGQLGLKVQHALRAFTANDRKAIKLAAENFPTSKYYDPKELLTKMAIGEALVTALNEKGVPTPLVETIVRSPKSQMGPITDEEVEELINKSPLKDKYEVPIDRESAYEILSRKQKEGLSGGGAGGDYWDFVVKNTFFRKLYNSMVREVVNSVMRIVGFKRR